MRRGKREEAPVQTLRAGVAVARREDDARRHFTYGILLAQRGPELRQRPDRQHARPRLRVDGRLQRRGRRVPQLL